MLLIGGFTIASALSKSNIDRVLITRVLSLAGTRPSTVLLAFMGVACFASMWIRYVIFRKRRVTSHISLFSNVAAPTLCFTLIKVCSLLVANIRDYDGFCSPFCGLCHRSLSSRPV